MHILARLMCSGERIELTLQFWQELRNESRPRTMLAGHPSKNVRMVESKGMSPNHEW